MLIRTRPRKKPTKVIWRLAELLIAALGVFALYLGAHGVLTGSVEVFSKRTSGVIHASSSPVIFWLMVALWIAGGIFLLSVAFNSWRGR